MNSNNHDNLELKDNVAAENGQSDYYRSSTISDDSRQEDQEDVRCCNYTAADTEERSIFRDLAPPTERSDDTYLILRSPAWSQHESMLEEDPEEPEPMSIDVTPPQAANNGAPSNYATRIADFDMSSGTVQMLTF